MWIIHFKNKTIKQNTKHYKGYILIWNSNTLQKVLPTYVQSILDLTSRVPKAHHDFGKVLKSGDIFTP